VRGQTINGGPPPEAVEESPRVDVSCEEVRRWGPPDGSGGVSNPLSMGDRQKLSCISTRISPEGIERIPPGLTPASPQRSRFTSI